MEYQQSIHVARDGKQAFDHIISMFTRHHFMLTKVNEKEARLKGSGMYSTKQNPLLGVSHAVLRLNGQTLKLEAELGGARFMQRFVMIFPFGLGVALALVFFAISRSYHALIALAAVSPWLAIAPIMSRWIRSRTVDALDVLLHNAEQTWK